MTFMSSGTSSSFCTSSGVAISGGGTGGWLAQRIPNDPLRRFFDKCSKTKDFKFDVVEQAQRFAQAVEAYVPAAQVAHVVQEAALVVVLKVDPATQETHPVFARAVHTVER
jgi:hypothetical protein